MPQDEQMKLPVCLLGGFPPCHAKASWLPQKERLVVGAPAAVRTV